MHAKLEVLALVLGAIGLCGTIATTALPTWKISAFIGANIIVMVELWEGLWMDCYREANFYMQCKAYDSVLILPPELQAARGLMCASIALVVIAFFLIGCGSQKTSCIADNSKSKDIIWALGGSVFLFSSLTTLIPVSWVANIIITDFYNPALLDAQKREIGQALFIGWATAGFLLVTGIIVLIQYDKRRRKEEQLHNETYLMVERDEQKGDSVELSREKSSFQKHQVYV